MKLSFLLWEKSLGTLAKIINIEAREIVQWIDILHVADLDWIPGITYGPPESCQEWSLNEELGVIPDSWVQSPNKIKTKTSKSKTQVYPRLVGLHIYPVKFGAIST